MLGYLFLNTHVMISSPNNKLLCRNQKQKKWIGIKVFRSTHLCYVQLLCFQGTFCKCQFVLLTEAISDTLFPFPTRGLFCGKLTPFTGFGLFFVFSCQCFVCCGFCQIPGTYVLWLYGVEIWDRVLHVELSTQSVLVWDTKMVISGNSMERQLLQTGKSGVFAMVCPTRFFWCFFGLMGVFFLFFWTHGCFCSVNSYNMTTMVNR